MYFLHTFFNRFWRGFGRVLGGQKSRKVYIFVSFGSMLFDTSILVEFRQILYEIHGEKRVDFSSFFVLFLVLLAMLETLKTSVLPIRNQYFHKIVFSHWMKQDVESECKNIWIFMRISLLQCNDKSLKNRWVSRSKSRKNVRKTI